ncbi:MAG TPA: TIGR02281 family clan AA aspartic protease [Xanthobacteraceae bacterium]|jgi:aspartyl protease family protein|nr:TIGR02281 family clan AA aspartic protease [Xanthobacteraceae bacterium]
MRSVISFAIMALVAAAIVPKYLGQMHAAGNDSPSLMAAHPVNNATPMPTGTRSVVISPGHNGHFQVEGRIDGRRLSFMVDTGASVIALTSRDAASLGIHPSERDYTAAVKTANGIARAAPVQLNMVEIDDIMVHNVAAMVMPDGALSDNLLGLSFLQKLHRFEYADGRLVLEQ